MKPSSEDALRAECSVIAPPARRPITYTADSALATIGRASTVNQRERQHTDLLIRSSIELIIYFNDWLEAHRERVRSETTIEDAESLP